MENIIDYSRLRPAVEAEPESTEAPGWFEYNPEDLRKDSDSRYRDMEGK